VNSSQLDLWEVELQRLPWRGRSPRVLTRGGKALFLRRKPQKDVRFYAGPEQLDMFHAATRKAPWRYQGAPLLKGG